MFEFKLCSGVQNKFSILSIVANCRFPRPGVVEEAGDVTEEDEDDEDGICFATLESLIENKGTV